MNSTCPPKPDYQLVSQCSHAGRWRLHHHIPSRWHGGNHPWQWQHRHSAQQSTSSLRVVRWCRTVEVGIQWKIIVHQTRQGQPFSNNNSHKWQCSKCLYLIVNKTSRALPACSGWLPNNGFMAESRWTWALPIVAGHWCTFHLETLPPWIGRDPKGAYEKTASERLVNQAKSNLKRRCSRWTHPCAWLPTLDGKSNQCNEDNLHRPNWTVSSSIQSRT